MVTGLRLDHPRQRRARSTGAPRALRCAACASIRALSRARSIRAPRALRCGPLDPRP